MKVNLSSPFFVFLATITVVTGFGFFGYITFKNHGELPFTFAPNRHQVASVEGAGSGLIGYWNFDDGSGSTAADSSGNGSNATLSGTTLPQWTTGVLGTGALSFDGSAAYVQAPGTGIGAGDTTVCAWVNATTPGSGRYYDIVDNTKFSLYIDTYNAPSLAVGYTPDGNSSHGIGTITSGSWHHICVVRSGTSFYGYIDGALANSGISATPVSSSFPTNIGTYGVSNSNFFNGSIDDVRIYDRPLATSEINQIFHESSSAVNPSTHALTVTNSDTSKGTIASVPTGLINCGSTCSLASITAGTPITLSATPNNGYVVSWTGCTSISGQTCNVTMNSDVTVAATFAVAPTRSGSTVTAVSCLSTDVQSAVDIAQDGDTIIIPASPVGTPCVWTQSVIVDVSTNPRAVTIKGAGIDQTVITDAVPMTDINQGRPSALIIITAPGKYFRLTGLTINTASGITGQNWTGTISAGGSSHTFRIDHIKIDTGPTSGRAIVTKDFLFGVIDHNTINFSNQAVSVLHNSWNNGAWGDGSWEDSLSLGTEKAMYIENNTITGPSDRVAFVTDAYAGARFVLRDNIITNATSANHGTDSSGRERSVSSYEVYGNNFIINPGLNGFVVFEGRGGTGIFADNTISGSTNTLVRLKNYRQAGWTSGTLFPAACDGSGSYDKNIKNPDGSSVVFDSGTYTGTSMATGTLVDDTRTGGTAWTDNQWVGYSLENVSQSWGSQILSNTSNTITYQGYATPNNPWETLAHNDTYRILQVDSCLDQVGRSGPSDTLTDDTQNPAPKLYTNETISPFYMWGNKWNGADANNDADILVDGYTIKKGRDYFVGVAPSSAYFSPYTCPHPLITTGSVADDTAVDSSYCTGISAPPTTNTITATAGSGGTIVPSGAVSVGVSTNQSFTVSANSGYQVNQVFIDGVATTLSNNQYTFSNVTSGHTIAVTFSSAVVQQTPPANSGGGGGGGSGIPTPVTLSISKIAFLPTTSSSVSVSWLTSKAATSQIFYGLTKTYSFQTNLSSTPVIVHSQILSGLTPNNLYHINIQSKDISGKIVESGDIPFTLSKTGLVVASTTVATTTNLTTVNKPTPTVTPTSTTGIKKPLYLTMFDPEVIKLQKILNAHGYTVATSGNGSPGHETTYFGWTTVTALKKFQCNVMSICSGTPATTGYGSVGTKTLAAINALEAGTKPAVSTPPAAPTKKAALVIQTVSTKNFTRGLSVGSVGDDVKSLQIYLNTHGYTISKSGNGSPGNESSYFGPATKWALAQFQAANNVVPATGWFGKQTIEAIKKNK